MSDSLPTQDFSEWQSEVMLKMVEIGVAKGTGGPLIDATIPYSLGWSPDRTARALLNLDRVDNRRLSALIGLPKTRG